MLCRVHCFGDESGLELRASDPQFAYTATWKAAAILFAIEKARTGTHINPQAAQEAFRQHRPHQIFVDRCQHSHLNIRFIWETVHGLLVHPGGHPLRDVFVGHGPRDWYSQFLDKRLPMEHHKDIPGFLVVQLPRREPFVLKAGLRDAGISLSCRYADIMRSAIKKEGVAL